MDIDLARQAGADTKRGPLTGVLVVALEQAVAAPLATRTLADLGARVIKVEHPVRGDFTRRYDDVARGMAAHFVWLNRGKESVGLDLSWPAGLEALHVLLGRADICVSNLGPGATKRLGIGPDDLAARYPRLIGIEISGYGTGGRCPANARTTCLFRPRSGPVRSPGGRASQPSPGRPTRTPVRACTRRSPRLARWRSARAPGGASTSR